MGYKRDDGTMNDRCLDNVLPGEPVFVLRAQDASAPSTIKGWLAANIDTLSQEHAAEANECIDNFMRWQADHPERVKQPD